MGYRRRKKAKGTLAYCDDLEQEIFCTEEFYFLGDMLALVVGETEECARLAAARVTKLNIMGGHKWEKWKRVKSCAKSKVMFSVN